MFSRILNPPLSRSFFLFGPRSTGKTTLLRTLFSGVDVLWIDLLDPLLDRRISQRPELLQKLIDDHLAQGRARWVVIDEIQKVPKLLDVVQSNLQKQRCCFALTGSSARKLKQGGGNLLAGRASWFELYSLTSAEIGSIFHLDTVLRFGSLPALFNLSEADKLRFLDAYVTTYLKEEVVAEQLVRKIQPFRNFLELAAVQNSQIVNYRKFARDCGVDTVTIQNYYEILQDTLIAFELPPYDRPIRKRQRKNPRYYFFDTGVVNALTQRLDLPVNPRSGTYGKLFEQFFITEILKRARIEEKRWKFSYLTTQEKCEVDVIIETPQKTWAIEVKSTDVIDNIEVHKLGRLTKTIPNVEPLYVSQDPLTQMVGNVRCLSWQAALQLLFPENG